MIWLVIIVAVAALSSWLYAAFNYVVALKHRQPDQSLISFLVGGYHKFFDADNFTDAGRVYRTRSLRGMGGFILLAMLATGLSFLTPL